MIGCCVFCYKDIFNAFAWTDGRKRKVFFDSMFRNDRWMEKKKRPQFEFQIFHDTFVVHCWIIAVRPESDILLMILKLMVFVFFILLLQLTGGNLIHDFRGPAHDYILSELDRRKGELRTQLVWIGAQKEPGFTARVWKWVNGKWRGNDFSGK